MCSRWWFVDVVGAPNSRQQSKRSFSQTLGWLVLNPYCHEWIACRQRVWLVISQPSSSGATRRPFADALRPFPCVVPPCSSTADGGVWCVLFTPRRYKTSCIRRVGRSYSLLIGNGIGLWPLGITAHNDQAISVSLVSPWEIPCYNDSYYLLNGAAIGCSGVALPAPLLNNVSCLNPTVPLLDLIQDPVDTHVTSWRFIM